MSTILSFIDGGAAGTFVGTRDDGEVRFAQSNDAVSTEEAGGRKAWLDELAMPHRWTDWAGPSGAEVMDKAHTALAQRPTFGRALGQSPALGTAAARLPAIMGESAPVSSDVLVVGDLEAAALGLAPRYSVTFAHDHGPEWAAGPHWDDVEVHTAAELFPPADREFDAVVLDTLPAGAALVSHLTRALARVKAGGRIFAVVHPRFRDEILPDLLEHLPCATRALHVDVVWRLLPGYSLQDVPWDVWELERTGDLMLGAPDGPPSKRTHLDAVDRVVLAEELLGFTGAVDGAHLDRGLEIFLAASGLVEVARESGEGDGRAWRRVLLEEGGFVDVSAEGEHGMFTFALGDWDPLTHLRLGVSLLLSGPSRKDHVVFRGAA